MMIDKDTIIVLSILISPIIAIGIVLFIIIEMKKFFRNIANTQTVSTEITYIAPRGTTLLSISCDKVEPNETFDVFFELASGNDINFYDSVGNRYEYWFPCIIYKEPRQTYRIVTSSQDKDLLTLTIIGRCQVIRRHLEVDFSRE